MNELVKQFSKLGVLLMVLGVLVICGICLLAVTMGGN